MKGIISSLLLVVSIACASNTAKEIKRNQNFENVAVSGQSQGSVCGDTTQSPAQNPRLLTISDLNGQSFSVCQLMERLNQQQQTRALVIQFTSSDCIGCQEEAAEITRFVQTNNLQAQVAHYVAFVDNSAKTANTIQNFMLTYAPIGVQVDDNNSAAAKILGKGDPIFPMAMVINSRGDFNVKLFENHSLSLESMLQSALQ